MENACIHAFISGRVQGVCFRIHAQAFANQLGLKGWVRNCRDGRVELTVCGNQKQIDRFISQLSNEVRYAEICELKAQPKAFEQFQQFDILSTPST